MSKAALAPSTFLSREMGLIAFNRRVLAQAIDNAVPLLERLRFLCIVSSNLDELFEVRVAELKERVKAGNEPSHRSWLNTAFGFWHATTGPSPSKSGCMTISNAK